MTTYTDQVIVLKRRNLGEADRILTLLTRRHGKLSAVAKGIRKTKSRKGGNLELFNLVEAKIAPGKNLDIVTEAHAQETFENIKKDLQRTGQAFYICELVDQLVPEDKNLEDVFTLTLNSLNSLTSLNSPNTDSIMKDFEIQLLKLSGFWSDKMFKDQQPETTDEWRRFNRVFIEQIIDRKLHSPRVDF